MHKLIISFSTITLLPTLDKNKKENKVCKAIKILPKHAIQKANYHHNAVYFREEIPNSKKNEFIPTFEKKLYGFTFKKTHRKILSYAAI